MFHRQTQMFNAANFPRSIFHIKSCKQRDNWVGPEYYLSQWCWSLWLWPLKWYRFQCWFPLLPVIIQLNIPTVGCIFHTANRLSQSHKVCICSHMLTLVPHSPIFLPRRWRRHFPPKRQIYSLQPSAHAGSSLANFSTLKTEAILSSETSVHTRSTVCSHLLTLVPRSRIFLPWKLRRYFPPKRRFTQDLQSAAICSR
jgi:hypothetical protein